MTTLSLHGKGLLSTKGRAGLATASPGSPRGLGGHRRSAGELRCPSIGRAPRSKGRLATVVLAMVFCPSLALAQDLMGLLEDGPVVMVKQDENGEFDQCTAVVFIRARPEAVWQVIGAFEEYTEFMPTVRRAEVQEQTETSAVVAWELQTPGRNTRYVMAYDLRPEAREIDVRWVSGDLRGTFGRWRLVPTGEGTLAYYTGATRNYSRILQRLEDDQQTVTIGVNVSSAIAMVRAVKERTESLAKR